MRKLLSLLFSASLLASTTTVVPAYDNGLWGTWPASKWDIPLSCSSPSLGGFTHALVMETAMAPEWVITIFGRLQRKVTADLRDITLAEAVKLSREVLQCNIILSPEAFESAKRFNLNVISMRGVLFLDWMCRLSDADWEIRGEAVFVFLKNERPSNDEEEKSLHERILEELDNPGWKVTDFVPPPFPLDSHREDGW